jgi:hypothetical protein
MNEKLSIKIKIFLFIFFKASSFGRMFQNNFY